MLGGCYYGSNHNQKRYKYLMFSNVDLILHSNKINKIPAERFRREYVIDCIDSIR